MPVVSLEHPAGFSMTLGARMRSRDAAEDVFHFARLGLPRAVDLSQPRTLSRWKDANGNVVDLRPEIENQGNLGACASYSAIACARVNARQAGRFSAVAPMLTGDRLYEMVRKAEGSWPADSGSALADNLDLLIKQGDTLESADPEHGQAAFDYRDLSADESAQEWIASHHPFYPSEGNTVENLWTAFDAGLPVQIGTSWAQSWFTPDAHGVVDRTATQAQGVGGHAIYAYAYWPPAYTAALGLGSVGVIVLANQWTPGWNTGISSSSVPDVRPGEFIVPVSVFTSGAASPIFECRAVSGKAIAPTPKPAPATDRYAPLWTWVQGVGTYELSNPNNPAEVAELGLVASTLTSWAAYSGKGRAPALPRIGLSL